MGPCASCKLSRRRCAPDCIFAPYFPSDDPKKYKDVHNVFGARYVRKTFKRLPVHQREGAARSLAYEANARERDPVNGCFGVISFLENNVSKLQKQLAVAQARIQNHEAVKGGKGNGAFETAQEKKPSVFAAAGERNHEAAEKRILKFPFDLNELPSDEDKGIVP